MKAAMRLTSLIFCIWAISSFTACHSAANGNKNSDLKIANSDSAAQTETPNTDSKTNANQTATTHEHHAPHGGTLVELGEEFAHLEIVLDAENGWLTAYALDGEAEKSVALAQSEIEIEIEKPQKFAVRLEAQENALTGETKGATSEFSGQDARLKNFKEFDASVKELMIRSGEFKNVRFNFPQGNETEKR